MFHVSKTNVRFGEPFGQDEEDKNLITNLTLGKIIQPFKARPENKEGHWEPGMGLSQAVGYGVVAGGRRFQGKKMAKPKFFIVGVDCLIEEMSDQEAREASLIENLFHKDLNPIIRAKRLKQIITERGESLRATARRWGIPPATLCEWVSVLKLSPKMQDVLAKRLLSFSDGMMITRMDLGPEMEDKMAEVIETQGVKAFKKLIRKKRSKNLAKGDKSTIKDVVGGKVFWKELTRSLREFADYWPDYCTLKEREDVGAYHLSLEVTMRKDLDETYEHDETHESDGLETLSADEAPQICGTCGRDILEGDPFAEKDGIYYCRECADKGLNH